MAALPNPNVLNSKPLLLDAVNNRFPEDIVIKINNIICDEYIKRIYEALENNLIKNTIKMFLNDKKLSKFLYYYGYQTYYFNNQMYYYNVGEQNLGIYGEILSNLDWGDFECETLVEDYEGIKIDTKEPYILNIPNDIVFTEHTPNAEIEYYKYDVNIYSKNLTLNETLWILKNYADYDAKILHDINECDYDTGICDGDGEGEGSSDDSGSASISIANFKIDNENTYDNIYDYDKEEFAIVWNLFNRGFIKLNIFKIIYIFCYHTDIDNTIQQYYNIIGGTGNTNLNVDNDKLFRKTCFNVVKYFNKKIKKTVENSIVISYLYAIYADDEGLEFNEAHEEYENKAYDILSDNGLLLAKPENIKEMLDLLYVLYLS
jgi:hypothetical protein